MSSETGSGQQSSAVPPPVPQRPRRTSGLAVASLILALIFFVPLAPLVGLVLGIIALVKISASKGAMGGRGLAIAGVVVGGFFTLILPALLLPALFAARDQARAVTCRSNLKQLGLAIGMYQSDYNEYMPPDVKTLAVEGYLKIGVNGDVVARNTPVGDTVLTCPSQRDEPLMSGDLDGTSSYYYAELARPQQLGRPGSTPIMWEKVKSHRRIVNVLWADMHVTGQAPEELRGQIEENAALYVKPPVLPEVED